MSAATSGRDDRTRQPPRLRRPQLPVLLWLTFVWVALWGDLSTANVLGGFATAVVVCLVFPLPAVRMGLHVHPLRLGWLVLHFLADVVAASAQVAWVTMQLHRQPRNAVIEIDLTTRSDFVLTVVAEMVSLVPGSLVVEARRSTHTLFLHVLDAKDMSGVEKMRTQVLALERRVLRALAPDGETDPERPSQVEPEQESP